MAYQLAPGTPLDQSILSDEGAELPTELSTSTTRRSIIFLHEGGQTSSKEKPTDRTVCHVQMCVLPYCRLPLSLLFCRGYGTEGESIVDAKLLN